MTPKDRDNITQKGGVIYTYKCSRLECDVEYIGEPARIFREILKEHLRIHICIYDHASTTGHHIKLDNFSIVGRKSHTIARTIMEAMFMRVNDPPLNQNTYPPGSAGDPHAASTTSTVGRYGVLQHHQFGVSHLSTKCLSSHN